VCSSESVKRRKERPSTVSESQVLLREKSAMEVVVQHIRLCLRLERCLGRSCSGTYQAPTGARGRRAVDA